MTFSAEELPTLSIITFNLQNLLNFNNIRLWPLKNFSLAHRLRNPGLKDTVTASFNTIMGQMTETSQRKKQVPNPGAFISDFVVQFSVI